MIVGTMAIGLRLHASGSLKDKRVVVKSVKERLRHRFNCSVAEVGSLDSWRQADLGVALVASSRKMIEREIEAITRFLDGDVRFDMVERKVEIEVWTEE